MKQEEFFGQGKKFFVDDFDSLAVYVKEHFPEEVKKTIADADRIADKKFVFNCRWDMERTHVPVAFEDEIDWLYQPGDDPEFIYAFNRMRFWITLGQAYVLTKDEKYAKAFVEQLCGWIDNVKRDDPENANAWRTIEAGIRMENWMKAICYFKGSPYITEEVLDKFVASMTEHAEYIMGIYNSYNLISNWGVLANHGLFVAGVMLPTTERTLEYRKEALRRLNEEISIQVYRDGTHWEQSPMYHNEVAHDYLDVVLLAQRNNIEIPEKIYSKTKDMCYVDLYWQKPDGNEVSTGDSDEIDVRDIVSVGAYIYRDGKLKFGGYEHLDFDSVWEVGYGAIAEYDAIKPETPEKLAFALNDSGHYYLRSGWDKNASFLHFRCGTLGGGHTHSDQLHFDLFSRGEDVLIDSGRYTYVNKPERFEFKDSTAHNTCTVDNKNFYVCTDSWACSKVSRPVNQKFNCQGSYGYVEGGHLGYYDIENGGVFVNRRIIAVEPDIFVVADEFYGCSNHTYQQYFHFNNYGTVSGDKLSFSYTSDRNNAELKLVSSHNITSQLLNTRLSRHYNELEPNVTLKTEISANGFASVFTVVSLNDPENVENIVVEKLPVWTDTNDTLFEDKVIEALNIQKGSRKYTVVVAHKEYSSPTITFCTDGCIGLGNVVVFDRAAGEQRIGTVLQW